MTKFWRAATLFLRDREGVTAIEYALIAGLVAVVAFTAMQTLGTNLTSLFNTIATDVKSAPGSTGG
ncbi:Flp family type IVb pilin [Acetobacter sacchari]|uniref:Flp family type IVb pilin n=1 Tax=Acetobacter sacchari TaxID=2661687 RepID=A0ABS3LY59_9PROT|nr:Flp family type IVb pilin [Acetobacter sacchari]MBO1360855.1 Flp family type IVb pilin [Acetobacter sacchari]